MAFICAEHILILCNQIKKYSSKHKKKWLLPASIYRFKSKNTYKISNKTANIQQLNTI